MTAYRAGPAAPGLPFPRKSLGLYTAIAIVVAAIIFLLPLPLFANASGWRMFKEGGVIWMSLILLSALASTAALAPLGAFAVRGKHLPLTLIAAVPALPLLLGVLGTAMGVRVTFGAIVSESVDPAVKFRIAAEGIAEASSCLVFGCLVGASACGAASIALLGSAASVDRTHAGAPPSGAWMGSLIAGIAGVLAMLVLRVQQKALFVSVLVLFPSLVLVTVLATVAARHGTLVRGWHDKQEANTWLSSLLAAAILASAGIVLVDLAASYMSERVSLGAVSGESVDPSQRARILYEGVHESRAATLFMTVNGVFTFATVAIGIFGAIGKGPDGSTRAPIGAPPFVALGGLLVFLVALFGLRAWTWGNVEKMAAWRDASVPAVELPRVKSAEGFNSGGDGPELIVFADGHKEGATTLTYQSTLVLTADRRAKWSDVSKHVRPVLESRRGYGSRPTLAIKVAAAEKPDLSALGRYAVFVGAEGRTISVSTNTDDFRYASKGWQTVRPKPTDDWETVVLSMQPNDTRYGGGGANILLLPPDGSW